MDSLTQALLGTAIAEAGFRKKLGWKAVLFGGLCGTLPDLDVFTAVISPWTSMRYHRGETHSFVMAPLIIFAAVLIFYFLIYAFTGKRENFWRWVHLAAWVQLTHIVLDWGTSYGTTLFAPISTHRYSLDAIAILDFFYSGPLFIALIAACIVKIPPNVRKGIAIGALVLSTGYFMMGFAQNRKALRIAAGELEKKNISVKVIRATPCLLTIFCWRIIAIDPEKDYHVGILSTWNPGPIEFHKVVSSNHPTVRKTLEHENGKRFAWFAQGLIAAETESDKNGTTVLVKDMRYGLVSDPLSPTFYITARFDGKGDMLSITNAHGKFKRSPGEEWDALWTAVAGKRHSEE
ncbi:MAG: metal-dependent hydrolase [Planctomycetota bacterium]|jgi:inner membrane protein